MMNVEARSIITIVRKVAVRFARCATALVLATLLVNTLLFFYERPAGWIDRTDSATEAIWRPGSWIRHGTEGNGYHVVDSNGYLNQNLPLTAEDYTVVVGASHTQGKEVREGQRYTDILNELLCESAGELEVYNVSQDGYYFPDIVNGFYALTREFPDAANIVIEIGTTDYGEEELKGALEQRGFDETQLGRNILSTLSLKKKLTMRIKELFPVLSIVKKQMSVLVDAPSDSEKALPDQETYERLLGQVLSLIRSEFDGNLIILYHPEVRIKEDGTMEVVKSST